MPRQMQPQDPPSMTPDTKIDAAKAATAWGGVVTAEWLHAIGVASWADAAALLAAIYSLILIAEWLWKRLRRPSLPPEVP